MTAYTVAAKRAAKRNRKAFDAVCSITGENMSAAKDAPVRASLDDDKAFQTYLAQRCAAMGWEPTEAHKRTVRSDQRMGTLYGRLMLVGRLGRSEASAQDAYAGLQELDRLDRQYARIVLGRPVPNDAEHGMAIHDEKAIKELSGNWVGAQGALTAMGQDMRRAVLDMIEAGPDTWPRDVPEVVALRAALGGLELARHFGLRL